MLRASTGALWDDYDLAVLDLDGVVYVGPSAVPGAPEHLAKAAAAGMRLAYVTNNAARPPKAVAEHLTALGVPADPEDVVTSAQAAARLVAERVPAGSPVFVIGGTGLFEALEAEQLRPVQDLDADPVAVVSGFHPDLRWRTVQQGAILVKRGLPWVASNRDWTVPTEAGAAPGNGVIVDVVARFAGVEPEVAGKPMVPLFEETRRRVGGSTPLVVGDRLDTDIEGANAAGLDSLLVLTGVTGLAEIVAADVEHRPTYLAGDLRGLGVAHAAPERDRDGQSLAGWTARVQDSRLVVTGDGDRDDWYRVAAAAAWSHLDDTGEPVVTDGLTPPGSVGADAQEEKDDAADG